MIGSNPIWSTKMLLSSNWLGHSPFTGKLAGSSPVRSTIADMVDWFRHQPDKLDKVGSIPAISTMLD